MSAAKYYPQHDRDSCGDHSIVNATAEGSTGCARCTALLLDQRDELLVELQRLLAAYRALAKLGHSQDDAYTVAPHNAIAKALGSAK